MMRRLTSDTSETQVAANDESMVVIGHEMVQVFCVHCGCLKNGFVLFVPGAKWEEYQIKQQLVKEQQRCLCPKREKQ